LVLLALLCQQAVRLAQLDQALAPVPVTPGLRWLLGLSVALLALQAALGGWVSTNYAVLACTDFPQCQYSWWPAMNFSQGFQLWRELGHTSAGAPIDFAALTAIHYMHRLLALLVLAALGVLAWRLNRVAALRHQSRWLAGLSGLQLATGLSNVVLDWPLLAAVLHTGGAAALVVVLTWASVASRRQVQPRAAITRFSPASKSPV
jgi:cytochrome c oxidase assembly protein subunit 15